ncbi:MAG: tripartite tricarboxylate transporter TctB family protein [Deltaproteobacteria bacterium]|nr:tripartite tricarboxylate transporter TctB family protein [Deltaproteobacteria bacterium]
MGWLIGTSSCLFFLSVSYLAMSFQYTLGTLEQPGSGLYPLLVGILMVGLSLSFVVQALKSRKRQHQEIEPFPAGRDAGRVSLLAGSLVLFALLVKPFGFALCAAGLLAATFRLLGPWGWMRIVIASLITVVLATYLFNHLLGVPLPAGTLFS